MAQWITHLTTAQESSGLTAAWLIVSDRALGVASLLFSTSLTSFKEKQAQGSFQKATKRDCSIAFGGEPPVTETPKDEGKPIPLEQTSDPQ